LNLVYFKSISKAINFQHALVAFVFMVVAYFTLFHQLGKATMYLWDESIYALNAQEMLERGNPIEVYLNNQPDLFNSKPPFAIWCMALSIKLLGFNEFAVRLPLAIFACCTGLLLLVFVKKETHNSWLGLGSALVLFTSTGYVGWHVARTADTDAILAFWVTLYAIMGYLVIKSNYSNKNKIWWFFVALTLACLTKGIAGLIGLPAIVGWWMFKTDKLQLFKTATFYYGILLFLTFVGGYYALRSYYTTGYAHAVWTNELGGRLNWQKELNTEQTSLDFYIKAYINQQEFLIWFYWFLVGVIYLMYTFWKRQRFGHYFIWVWLVMVTLLSFSATKFEWYDAPLFPIMAIVLVLAINQFTQAILQQFAKAVFLLFTLSGLFLFGKITKQNIANTGEGSLNKFMQLVRVEQGISNHIVFINKEASFNLFFYMKKDKLEGYNNAKSLVHHQIKPNTLVAVTNDKDECELSSAYQLQLLTQLNDCKLFKVVRGKGIVANN
jgi:4-amino-4-deoxy-L-arabinose transferase-like glycosyltransferase